MYSNYYLIANQIFKVMFLEKFLNSEESIFKKDILDLTLSLPKIKVTCDINSSIITHHLKSNNMGIVGIKTKESYIVNLFDFKQKVGHIINSSLDWTDIFVMSSMAQKLPFEGSVGEVIFKTSILFNKGIVIHASAIEVDGKGIVFSAPSGTGKSTQADLWVAYKNAKILNADRPAIRVFDDKVQIYGTPWSGTSKQYLNMSAPLEAIFMLEQSPTNKIIELSSSEALRRITARCYLPYFDEELMSLALDNIGAIIQRTPVYLLKCRPDSEAVDVVASCLRL